MKAAASKRLVIDASITVSWCFEDEQSAHTESVLEQMASGAEAVVPSLWPFETANALLTAERHRRLTAAQSSVFLEQLKHFAITIDAAPLALVFDRIVSEARRWNLTAYDAAYLELALRLGLPLATLDEHLKRAAKALGVSAA